jgi:glutamyl-tRNA reductase
MGCLLQIGVLGINHKTANLAFREEIARAASGLAGQKGLFFPHPIVLLSTCNRTEIYFGGEDLSTAHSDLLAHLRTVMVEPFEHRLYSYFGIDCFAHLARVTAGLDSAIVAETEIQGQVKTAYARACKLTPCMHYIFQKSLQIGKQVRTQYRDLGAITLFQAIWQLSKQHLGDLETKKILLIGNSETNRGIAHFFSRRNASQITFCTRTQIPNSVDRTELIHYAKYDLVISATTSSETLLTGPKTNLIFDLSVPRTIDPALTTYNIEQVHRWIEQQRALQTEELTRSEDFIWQETTRLARAYRSKILLAAVH